ncbi:MAG: hypothetical protein H0T46_27385 [Deltaproteobacteria bacterium]|nr:hypothetical protein [Deltaproteobacteria bacterium]
MKRLRLPQGVPQAIYWDAETSGFGVVVGKTSKTFVANGWVAGTGRKKRIAIGQAGEPGPNGALWSVTLARKQARVHLGQMSAGAAPKQLRRSTGEANGPTLRDAYEAHLDRLRKKQRAEATIETLEKGLPKYLSDWMDRPIADLTGEVLATVHERIKAQAKARSHANPANPKGGAVANRVIAQVSACWSTLNKRLSGALGTWNPAKSVEKDSLKPKRTRLSDVALPDWYARVQTMRNPIQRDGLVFALFTGLRSEDVRTTRFEHVDFEARTLRLPDPKGGEGRAFTIPLCDTALAIIERRKRENGNELLIAEGGGDNGYVFPGLDAAGEVGPIADLRQQVHEGAKHTRFPAEDVHTLRRTYESVAHEAGVSELDLHVLTNHSYASHNVNATYISQHLDHLARCQAAIEGALWSRIKPKATTQKAAKKAVKRQGRHLRAVP